MNSARWWGLALLLLGCPTPIPVVDAGTDAGTSVADASVEIDAGPACLALETVDLDQADAGRAFLLGAGAGGDFVPRLAFDNLWRVWGTGQPADFAAAARARYGFSEALTFNDGLPMGLHLSGNQVRADCLVCHAGVVAGQTVIGAPNNQIDLELLIDDLKALAMLAGFPAPNTPTLRTGARGVSDIVGMTLQLGLRQGTPPFPVNTEIGFQDPPAWWALATKTRVYTDGSAPQSGHRTFMATQLAFGTTQAQLEALEPSYLQLRQYLLTLGPPAWPFTAPDPASVERGRTIFRAQCTSCHRDDRCERMASVEVAQLTVGTDPERALKYGEHEVSLINGTWFGAVDPHRATGSYVAPSLRGVWASAPYLHNGSVPTLTAVLDSTQRPRFFRLRGTARADYDEVNVGLKVEVFAAAPANQSRADRAAVYDTTKVGLGNGGHLFGDALTPQQRADVVAFLETQ